MMLLLLLLALSGDAAAAGQAAEPGVRPIGAYPFVLPGLLASQDVKPKLLAWCRGTKLLGVVALEEPGEGAGAAPQGRVGPAAFLLRDGRCEPDGSGVSFGFLVPMKAWVYEAAGRTPPEERTAWLLHRFQGSVTSGVLKGTLVQVDVNHPGYSFREARIEVAALPGAQASFADDSSWVASISRQFDVTQGEP